MDCTPRRIDAFVRPKHTVVRIAKSGPIAGLLCEFLLASVKIQIQLLYCNSRLTSVGVSTHINVGKMLPGCTTHQILIACSPVSTSAFQQVGGITLI
jgi:hypothetical protein